MSCSRIISLYFCSNSCCSLVKKVMGIPPYKNKVYFSILKIYHNFIKMSNNGVGFRVARKPHTIILEIVEMKMKLHFIYNIYGY